jgi:hypothetical protein
MANPRMTHDQRAQAWRGRAVATVETVASVLRERRERTLDLDYRESIDKSQEALAKLCNDIRSGKVPVERVQALTWVQEPKVDLS